MRRRGIAVLWAMALAVGAGCPASLPPSLHGRLICGVQAPEDLEVMPDQRHVIISETPGAVGAAGALAVLDTGDDRVRILPRVRDHGPNWGDPRCTDPGAARFGPLGIHLSRRADGALELLVVDHPGAVDRIAFYQVMGTGEAMVAAWRGCVANGGPGMFNDVAASPGGGFVASVMFDRTVVFTPHGDISPRGAKWVLDGAQSGYLMAWTPGGALHKLPGSAAPFNNGVQLSRDGRSVYFAAWTGRQLRRYDIAAGMVTARLDVDFLPDNISVEPDGRLLVAGIGDARTWFACVQRAAAFCDSGFKVVEWDPRANTARRLLDVPAGPMPGASVAVRVGRYLYIGSFSGDRILKLVAPVP